MAQNIVLNQSYGSINEICFFQVVSYYKILYFYLIAEVKHSVINFWMGWYEIDK